MFELIDLVRANPLENDEWCHFLAPFLNRICLWKLSCNFMAGSWIQKGFRTNSLTRGVRNPASKNQQFLVEISDALLLLGCTQFCHTYFSPHYGIFWLNLPFTLQTFSSIISSTFRWSGRETNHEKPSKWSGLITSKMRLFNIHKSTQQATFRRVVVW